MDAVLTKNLICIESREFVIARQNRLERVQFHRVSPLLLVGCTIIVHPAGLGTDAVVRRPPFPVPASSNGACGFPALRSLLPPGVRRPPKHGAAPGLSGFVPVRSILGSISITQQRLKQLDTIQLVRELRENGKQELAYHTRPFVLCGIPLRRPPAEELVHRRQNGKFFLEIIAHPRFGLPWLLLAESHLTRRLFGTMLRRIWAVPVLTG